MNPDRFAAIYADADLRDYIADMARRLSPTREVAEDCAQEAWLAVAQAPDGASVASLRSAVTTSVASAAWQYHGKPSRAWKKWIRVLREYGLGDINSRRGMV